MIKYTSANLLSLQVVGEFGFDCMYGSETIYVIRASLADIQLADIAMSKEQMINITKCEEKFKGKL